MPQKSEIGKIDKVSISDLGQNSKKLLEIPFFFYRRSIRFPLPTDYDEKVDQFYTILEEWIQQISTKIGKINRVYVESLTKSKEKIQSQLQDFLSMNERLLKMIEAILKLDAQLEQTENEELFNEYMAWVIEANSPNALDIDTEYVIQTKKERASFITNMIKTTLGAKEIGILFIDFSLTELMEYPMDIETIKFRPPILDDIVKFFQ
jgi:hypothetical protein